MTSKENSTETRKFFRGQLQEGTEELIGDILSRFKVFGKLGSGGMDVAYTAQDTKFDGKVALRFLPKHLLCDEGAKTRLAHEAKAASALNHNNITTIHGIDKVKDQCFIYVEYTEGKSIKEPSKETSLSAREA